jgi:hypothetical protein
MPAPTGRRLPFGLRLLKHTQGIVTTLTALGVLYFRSTHSLYYVGCSLGTSFTAKGLKKVIKAPRPPPRSSLEEPAAHGVKSAKRIEKEKRRRLEERVTSKTEHGMPSTHSA